MGLQRLVGGEEAGLGGEVLGGVRRLAAVEVVVVAPRRELHHPERRAELHVGLGERVGDGLVGADRAVEHDPFLGVGDGAADRRLADAARRRGQQDPLGVESVQQVLEATAPLADHAPALHGKVVVDDLALSTTALRPSFGMGEMST